MKKAANPRKRSYHHGNLRQALLAASLKLVTTHGVEAFSLREAARAVGVSVAAAYRHFEDRSALLRALAHEGLAQLALEMEEAVATAPGAPGSAERSVAEFSRIGAAYVEFAVAHPSRFRVMFGPWCDLADELPPELLPHGRDPLQVLVDTLDGMVGAGAITAVARRGAEISAWATVHGFASLLVAGGVLGTGDVAQTYPAVLRTLLLGLGVSPALVGPESGTNFHRATGTGGGVRIPVPSTRSGSPHPEQAHSRGRDVHARGGALPDERGVAE